MAHFLPSPMAYALLLTLITLIAGAAVGEVGPLALIDEWASGRQGFWSFLGFAMQMTLILLTGTVVAESPASRRVLQRLAGWPSNARSATVMVAIIAAGTGLVHWGLGLIVGAVLAREVGRTAAARGIPMHYPTLAAGGYSGMLVWHGGLSGSAPLKVTTSADLIEVLGSELAARVGELPLTETLFSGRNIAVSLAMWVAIPLVLTALIPRSTQDYVLPPDVPEVDLPQSTEGHPLDVGPWLVVPIVLVMGIWAGRWLLAGGWRSLDPNALNFLFFGLGLLLAGSPERYMALAARGAEAATGILVQFPLYAGIRGILVTSGLGTLLATLGSGHLVLSTFLSAGLLNLFVPSGGGQWGIQGPIALAAAMEQGIDPARVVLAVAWGDQWTNAFQPFWALPLLGITGAKAGDLLATTAVLGVVTGLILLLGVLL